MKKRETKKERIIKQSEHFQNRANQKLIPEKKEKKKTIYIFTLTNAVHPFNDFLRK